jgi:hypothetical protein
MIEILPWVVLASSMCVSDCDCDKDECCAIEGTCGTGNLYCIGNSSGNCTTNSSLIFVFVLGCISFIVILCLSVFAWRDPEGNSNPCWCLNSRRRYTTVGDDSDNL